MCCNRPNNEHVIMEQLSTSELPRLFKMLGSRRGRRTWTNFQRSPSAGRERISSICGGRVVSPNYIVSSRRLAAPRGIRPVVTVIKKLTQIADTPRAHNFMLRLLNEQSRFVIIPTTMRTHETRFWRICYRLD